MLYIAEHIIFHAPLHRNRLPVLVLDTRLAAIASYPQHLLPQFLVELRHCLLMTLGLRG